MTGMFSIAVDSFNDSQNFLHAFKSLLSRSGECFRISALAKSSQFRFLLVPSSAGLKIASVCSLYLLPRSGLLVRPFSIINKKKPFFCLRIFEDKYYSVQDRSRCRSRWENLDRCQYPF